MKMISSFAPHFRTIYKFCSLDETNETKYDVFPLLVILLYKTIIFHWTHRVKTHNRPIFYRFPLARQWNHTMCERAYKFRWPNAMKRFRICSCSNSKAFSISSKISVFRSIEISENFGFPFLVKREKRRPTKWMNISLNECVSHR